MGSMMMDTVGKDVQPVASRNQEVELSHFLLLRMCRVMDLWCLGVGVSPGNGSPAWFWESRKRKPDYSCHFALHK